MCSCTSCKATDKLAGEGFAKWPRGNPAGRSSATDYARHVSHNQRWHGEHGPAIPSTMLSAPGDGSTFYGSSPGLSKSEVRAVLRRSFGLAP